MQFITIISFVFILFIDLAYQQNNDHNLNSYELREFSLNRPYPAVFSTSNSHWHLVGNTVVTDRYVRLTADAQSKAGGLWNTIPVTFPDWEMHVHFKVHGSGQVFFGDGFAIWYVKDPKLNGPVFGYQDYFHGLGIFMDTYSNQNGAKSLTYPYISAVINNGSLHYDHDQDGIQINAAGCESSFRGRDSDTLVAIRYQNNRLTISTDIEGNSVWKECFTIDDVRLPTHYYFGFSAATGELSDNHDIISVHTYQLDTSEERRTEDRKYIIPSVPLFESRNVTGDASQTSSWSALKVFFLVVFLIIVCLGGIGVYYYTKSRRYHSSRLY